VIKKGIPETNINLYL